MVQGLGDKLHKLRLEFNMSQKEVAGIINTSPSIISNYEWIVNTFSDKFF